ncbi:MAG: hypothetical protein DHS20C15_29260 [Planctomycetota bacterium]|nr:MAG: hypothetical protein DHS20C15_29260 [Planctomycetota bacterium]
MDATLTSSTTTQPDIRPIIGREHLMIALLRLGQPERELIDLHFRGESLACIARRAKLDLPTARARLHRVLARTRELAANLASVAPAAA